MLAIYPDKINTVTPLYADLTGTITFTNGSDQVTGVGSLFDTEVEYEGTFIKLNADDLPVEVLTVDSDTVITLTANYTGTGGTGTASVKQEDPNYPADNVLDPHPKRPYKAISKNDATLEFLTNGGANACAIFGTNAEQVTINVYDETKTTLEYTESFNIKDQVTTYLELMQDSGRRWSEIWINYPYQIGIHIVELIFSRTGSVTDQLYVGIVRDGQTKGWRDVRAGLKQSLEDYSVKRQLNNGAFYYLKRDIVRTFNGQIIANRVNRDFYNFLIDVAQDGGEAPIAWYLSEHIGGRDLTVFAKLDGMPDGDYSYPQDNIISFKLTEVV